MCLVRPFHLFVAPLYINCRNYARTSGDPRCFEEDTIELYAYLLETSGNLIQYDVDIIEKALSYGLL